MGVQQDGPGPALADAVPSMTTIAGRLAATTIEEHAMPTSFPRFPDLPTELRLKIWKLSFAPRVVEVHRRKSHYADDYHAAGGGRGSAGAAGPASLAKWQSWSANPAALAVSYEARACALEHYSATIRLAVNTPCERAGEARLDLHRRLYLAPHADTLAVLGEFNVAQTVELLRHIASQTVRAGGRGGHGHGHEHGRGLRRLAMCASSIGHPGSGILLLIYSRNIFRDLDQLVLFLYDEREPPADWHDGHCALVDCRDTYTFRRFQAGQGAELRSQSGGAGWMTVGHGPLEVLDLAFGREAEAASTSSSTATTKLTTLSHKSGARFNDESDRDKRLPHVTTFPVQPGSLDDDERWVPVAP
ncbi:hypothetical protein HMPREF1624_02193 [Sporothrix schenckii ATCC 58251]|uniref:2EXR domain-containing protein n=1 Tax=Sporothrix schenckii (strain ATCC 58251 / de Perez 2211183) TaxID=1391915 RepID=U7PZE9_SPOS1|nr:hypothetical protein HMPREF1624_02193 [Sporothrix schenckii ATCC 58251]